MAQGPKALFRATGAVRRRVCGLKHCWEKQVGSPGVTTQVNLRTVPPTKGQYLSALPSLSLSLSLFLPVEEPRPRAYPTRRAPDCLNGPFRGLGEFHVPLSVPVLPPPPKTPLLNRDPCKDPEGTTQVICAPKLLPCKDTSWEQPMRRATTTTIGWHEPRSSFMCPLSLFLSPGLWAEVALFLSLSLSLSLPGQEGQR